MLRVLSAISQPSFSMEAQFTVVLEKPVSKGSWREPMRSVLRL